MVARLSALVSVFAVSVLLGGCAGVGSMPNEPGAGGDVGTGSGGNGTPGAGQSGTPVSDEQRMAALDDASAKFESLTGQDPSADNQEMARFLSGRPEFEEAGVSDDSSVWARFTDGELLIVVNNREPAEEGQVASVPSARQTVHFGVPKPLQVRVVNSLGNCYGSPVTTIGTWLDDAGYIVSGGGATVEDLRGVAGDGLFYIDAHGGTGRTRSRDMFAVWTATEASLFPGDAIRDDLRNSRLCYMIAKHDSGLFGCKTARHYAITSKFVTKYMSFGENSFVFINACSSSDLDFKVACFDKGASVYAGWTAPVGDGAAFTAAKYLIDRMLGANAYVQYPEDPKQRPFTYEFLWGDATFQGLANPTNPATSLVIEPNWVSDSGGDFGLLAPSIWSVGLVEKNEAPGAFMFINGFFGEEQGKVTVGGTEIPVTTWDPGLLQCDLPPSGAGSAGDVIVEVNGRKSNARQITEWRGPFHITRQSKGSLQATVQCNVHLRGDINNYRFFPHEAPQAFSLPLDAVTDSTATFAASGSQEYQDGDDTVTVEWQTNGPSELGVLLGPERRWDFWGGDFEPDFLIIDSIVFNVDVPDGIQQTVTRVGPDGSETSTSTLSFSFGDYHVLPAGEDLNLTLDDQFKIEAGRLEADFGDDHVILEWDEIPPTFPPDPAAARNLALVFVP